MLKVYSVVWRNMSHDIIDMSLEQCMSKLFCEVISHINCSIRYQRVLTKLDLAQPIHIIHYT